MAQPLRDGGGVGDDGQGRDGGQKFAQVIGCRAVVDDDGVAGSKPAGGGLGQGGAFIGALRLR